MKNHFNLNKLDSKSESTYGIDVFIITDEETGVEYIYVNNFSDNACLAPRLRSNDNIAMFRIKNLFYSLATLVKKKKQEK